MVDSLGEIIRTIIEETHPVIIREFIYLDGFD
jgi:hypothetical protein